MEGLLPEARFSHPDTTATGDERARVPLRRLETLWINTGTLCNITCRNCYIESSPRNDRLAYMTLADALPYLEEAEALDVREIGFTGGEPFLNPDFPSLLVGTLGRGFDVLVLTNAMRPMQRPKLKAALLDLLPRYGRKLTLRVSLDHYTRARHEMERGRRSWEPTIAGLDWLAAHGFQVALAGRMCWGETEADARAGYAALIRERRWPVDAADPAGLVLLPEMDEQASVPEITTACWSILHKDPGDMMCASSRMVVKRKGAARPVVLPCTLLPYDARFEMGGSLADAAHANDGMFDRGAVKLCHPHCAKFCVLGGGSCSVRS